MFDAIRLNQQRTSRFMITLQAFNVYGFGFIVFYWVSQTGQLLKD